MKCVVKAEREGKKEREEKGEKESKRESLETLHILIFAKRLRARHLIML